MPLRIVPKVAMTAICLFLLLELPRPQPVQSFLSPAVGSPRRVLRRAHESKPYCRRSRWLWDHNREEFCTGSGYIAGLFQGFLFRKGGARCPPNKHKTPEDGASSRPEGQSDLRYRNQIQLREKIFPALFILCSDQDSCQDSCF